LKSGSVFSIANVYTPCDGERDQELWSRLGELINNYRKAIWCVNGDFNAI